MTTVGAAATAAATAAERENAGTKATAASAKRRGATPWLLSAPAALLFAGVVLVPLAMTLILSFHDFSTARGIQPVLILRNWREVLTDPYYHEMFLRTLRIAGIVTLLCALVGAPETYIVSRMSPRWRALSLLVILGPLLISVVARTLGWALLFGGRTGLVNQALLRLHLIDAPLAFMFTETGIVIALTHVLMPFMVLAVWTALARVDRRSEQAAVSLGAGPFTVLRRIVLPQVMPGMLSGAIIVFALAASAFATPAIIGGRRLKVAATAAYDEFLNTLDWPLGATIAVLLLVGLVAIVVGANRLVERRYAHVFESAS